MWSTKERRKNHSPHIGKVPDQSAVFPPFAHITVYVAGLKWYPKLQVYVNEVSTGDEATFGETFPLAIGGGKMHVLVGTVNSCRTYD